jgi:hypothetical protein
MHEVEFEGGTSAAKIAQFGWNIPAIERETQAYGRLQYGRDVDPEDYPPIAPAFFGHWAEAVRVIGLLMERVVGTRAVIGDLESCRWGGCMRRRWRWVMGI